MKLNKIIFLGLMLLLEACGAQQNPDSKSNDVLKQSSCIKVTVNGSLCGKNSYVNQPCMSVTVNGQVINNILLDTGSFGLRVFKSVLKTELKPIASGSGTLAECVQFGDGSSQWGPIMRAEVQLGEKSFGKIPIMVIDANHATEPSGCTTQGIASDNDPEIAGFNGILGVGFFAQDCGSRCVIDATVNRYFSCTGSTCTPTMVPLADQVQNPAAIGNNGIVLDLPPVGHKGAVSVEEGCLYLGFGELQSNLVRINADPKNGYVTTIFNGDRYTTSFLDTGSNGLYFPGTSLKEPHCNFPLSQYFCPSGIRSLSATLNGTKADFEIANANDLALSGNLVFRNIGAHMPGIFDWGLPFFLGKKIYVGISETAPYWAY